MSTDIKTGPVPEAIDAAPTSDRTEIATRTQTRAVQHASEAPRQPMSPGELIQYAIDNKLPAAELKELVALHEQMEARNAAQAFNRAMAAFQNECPPIKKNKTANIATRGGGKFSYSYAERDEIEAHIKPFREKYDLSHTFDTVVDEKGVMLTNICTVSHILGHSRSSRFTLPIANDSAASPQQKVGAADSYAARRTLAAAYGLSITDKEVPDEEVDATTVTEDQATYLSDLQQEVGANREKFLAWLDVDSFFDIRATDYERAVAALKAKKGGRAQ